MTSCPDKPTASVMGCLCLGLACTGLAPAPDRSVLPRHEEQERFVRLEGRFGGPLGEGVTQFSHPLRLSPAEWARLLAGVRIQSRKDSFIFTPAKDPPAEAFAPEEIGYLSRMLSDVFAKATPNEWVAFGMSRVLPSGVNEVTTGGLFVEGPRLHLILANYRQSVTKSAVRESLWTAPLRTLSAPFYEVVEEEYRTVVRETGLFKRLLHNAGPEIVIEYQAMLAAKPAVSMPILVPAPPPAASPAESSRLPASILEESLQALKRLRDQDLITEEEYRQKKKGLLDRF